jgi:hypothetical protein
MGMGGDGFETAKDLILVTTKLSGREPSVPLNLHEVVRKPGCSYGVEVILRDMFPSQSVRIDGPFTGSEDARRGFRNDLLDAPVRVDWMITQATGPKIQNYHLEPGTSAELRVRSDRVMPDGTIQGDAAIFHPDQREGDPKLSVLGLALSDGTLTLTYPCYAPNPDTDSAPPGVIVAHSKIVAREY